MPASIEKYIWPAGVAGQPGYIRFINCPSGALYRFARKRIIIDRCR
jgi:hypothetical protein